MTELSEHEGQELNPNESVISTKGKTESRWRSLLSLTQTLIDVDACRAVMDRLVLRKAAEIEREPKFRSYPGEISHLHPVAECEYLASPCPMNWNRLPGSGRIKICTHCRLSIYDFESLEPAQVRTLILQREGRADVTIYRRKDGKYMTCDCPYQREQMKKMVLTIAIAAFVLLGFLVAFAVISRHPPTKVYTHSSMPVPQNEAEVKATITVIRRN